MSRRHAAVAAVALALFAACKGETKVKYKTDKATQQQLKTCEESREILQKQVADLKLKTGTDPNKAGDADANEIVLRIEGNDIKITPQPAVATNRKRPVVGDAQAKELYKAFQAKVASSRGAFRKCYTTAMKKAPALQGQVISMNLSVRFESSGAARGVSLSKGVLGPIFSSCMNGVVKKWKLPAAPAGFTFQAPVTLTPQ